MLHVLLSLLLRAGPAAASMQVVQDKLHVRLLYALLHALALLQAYRLLVALAWLLQDRCPCFCLLTLLLARQLQSVPAALLRDSCLCADASAGRSWCKHTVSQ